MRDRLIRVLYVTHASNLTGASRSLLDLLRGLNRDRVDPTVLLRSEGPIEEKLRELGIRYFVIPYVTNCKSKQLSRPTAIKKLVAAACQPRINRFVREGNFDLVHNNSLLVDAGMLAARHAKVPYICHVRDLGFEDHGMVFMDESRLCGLMRDASLLIYISEFVAEKFCQWVPDVPSLVIHNAVSPSLYLRHHDRLFDSAVIRLILVGRIAPGKGQLEAIRATELLQQRGLNVHLTVVGGIGDSEYNQECKSYVTNHNMGYVAFESFTDDLTDFRLKSDVALVCSTSEAMGRVTVEGMMSGCLVVGACAGATPELIESGCTGLLYEAGNPAALADAVEWAFSHPLEANEIAARGQMWAAETFEPEVYSNRITGLYDDLLGLDSI